MSIDFNKNGNITISKSSDIITKSLSDGSKWFRIFYHNNKSGTLYFSSDDNFVKGPVIKDENRYSRLNLLENFKCTDGYVFELMVCQPDDGGGTWRWKQTKNFTHSTTSGTVTFVSGTSSFTKGLMICDSNTHFAQTATTSDWWCAIGCYKAFNGGIPGLGGITVKGGLELWVRYDNIAPEKLFEIFDSSIYESDSYNLFIYNNQLPKTFIPSSALNSTFNTWTIDFTGRLPGEKIYVEMDISWSGFEKTTSAGTFNMWFQGDCYKNSTGEFVWENNSGMNQCWYNGSTGLGNSLTSLVTSSTSGSAHLTGSFTLPTSWWPHVYCKQRLGLRSDYSNGTGKLVMNNIKIIPEKYYISQNTGATKIAKNNEIIIDNIIEY